MYLRQLQSARRVGATAIACAVILRLFLAGVPAKIWSRLTKPNTEIFPQEQETGHNVRFSSSLDTFSPDFMESPSPFLPEPTEVSLPSFSGEEEVELYYAASKAPDIENLLEKPLEWNLFSEEPSVLILHTHATESYTKHGEDYKETSAWRTLAEDYNMLSIGQRVKELLESQGIGVIHDRELYDYPSYNGSYTRARKAIREILEDDPGIRLILDLHRDASGEEGNQMRPLVTVNEQKSARMMVVIGTNHEDYEENLSLGLKLHAQLQQQAEGIMRPLQLRAQRFNQDLSPGALLIEMGAAGNSHGEAIYAAEQLAKAIAALAGGTVTE